MNLYRIASRMKECSDEKTELVHVLESDYGIKINNDMDRKGILLLQAAAQFGAAYGDVFINQYRQECIRKQNEEHRKRKEANIKRIAEINRKRYGEKTLRKFVINGNEVEAHSRKDAIVRLKHKGLL